MVLELKKDFDNMSVKRAMKCLLFGYLKQGIGMSKREIQNNRPDKYSPLIHSYSTFERYAGILKQFADDMVKLGKKKFKDITYEDVKTWLDKKASLYTESTLKANVCALEKLFYAAKKFDIVDSLKEEFQGFYEKAKANGRAEPFVNPKRVLNTILEYEKKAKNKDLKDLYKLAYAWASIQYYSGARVGDIKKLRVEGNKVVIEKSKGGRTRVLDFSDAPYRIEKLKKALSIIQTINLEFKTFRKDFYYPILKEAVKKAGERYTGSHSFRVNFAIERFNEIKQRVLKDNATVFMLKTELEKIKQENKNYTFEHVLESYCDRLLTREMGHNRESMSKYYRSA
ncbi:hypothetical protein [Hydrogenobaculum acidophilum]